MPYKESLPHRALQRHPLRLGRHLHTHSCSRVSYPSSRCCCSSSGHSTRAMERQLLPSRQRRRRLGPCTVQEVVPSRRRLSVASRSRSSRWRSRTWDRAVLVLVLLLVVWEAATYRLTRGQAVGHGKRLLDSGTMGVGMGIPCLNGLSSLSQYPKADCRLGVVDPPQTLFQRNANC